MELLTKLRFDESGLIPAIIQDVTDGRVLTLCYMTDEAVRKTIETGKIHVFRRSKGRLMLKGETSGHIQHVRHVALDCEGKSLLFRVDQRVAACHVGYKSCYFQQYDPETDQFVIRDERIFDPDEVY